MRKFLLGLVPPEPIAIAAECSIGKKGISAPHGRVDFLLGEPTKTPNQSGVKIALVVSSIIST